MRGSMEPRIEQFSRGVPRAMEPITGIGNRRSQICAARLARGSQLNQIDDVLAGGQALDDIVEALREAHTEQQLEEMLQPEASAR